MTKKVPETVLKAAKDTLELLKGEIVYLGEKDGFTYYILRTNAIYGEYPFVYRYDGHEALEMTGQFALDIEETLMVE